MKKKLKKVMEGKDMDILAKLENLKLEQKKLKNLQSCPKLKSIMKILMKKRQYGT
jgi:hypothetical protein